MYDRCNVSNNLLQRIYVFNLTNISYFSGCLCAQGAVITESSGSGSAMCTRGLAWKQMVKVYKSRQVVGTLSLYDFRYSEEECSPRLCNLPSHPTASPGMSGAGRPGEDRVLCTPRAIPAVISLGESASSAGEQTPDYHYSSTQERVTGNLASSPRPPPSHRLGMSHGAGNCR